MYQNHKENATFATLSYTKIEKFDLEWHFAIETHTKYISVKYNRSHIRHNQYLCRHVGICICIPYLFSLNMNDYTLDYTADAWQQRQRFTLPGHLFSHLGFPSVRVVLSVNISPRFVMLINQ